MSSAAIDSHVLNSLFDNQKKLDDLLDSVFDDDNFYITASSAPAESYSSYSVHRRVPVEKNRMVESLSLMKAQHPYIFMLPVLLEIAAIYFVASNFL